MFVVNTEKAIRKYIDMIRSDTFLRYEKEFAHRMVSSLSKDYLELGEEDVVRSVENVVNGIDQFAVKDTSTHFEIKTSALFIHGNISQVGFDYYAKYVERELGDLIFICSIVFNNKKCFEKLTINQFKKDSSSKKSTSWNLSNREQLYLLSRFPKFIGVSSRGSMIPASEFTLPNKSGCLGSYGLLYKPGDFCFISATELEGYVGSRKSLKESDFYDLTHKIERSHFGLYPLLHLDPDYYKFMERCFHRCFDWPLPWDHFGNHHYAHNAFDFTHKYLTMGIGEPIFMITGPHNSQARHFISKILSKLKIRAQQQPQLPESQKILTFVEGFHKFNYGHGENEGGNDNISDFDGEGIGIMHTTINLGE